MRVRLVVVVVGAVLVAAACGGDGDAATGSGSGSEGSGSLASAVRIDDSVDARLASAADFVAVGERTDVAVDDVVRTDGSGFAEVAYFDGSLTRLDVDTEFTVVALSDDPDGSEVRTAMGLGRTWHRVEQLAGGDSFVVETSVAVATVRGTAFMITCTPAGCVFDVLEGTVEVTVTTTAQAVAVAAGESLTVPAQPGADPPAAGPSGAATTADAWLARNLDLDTDTGFGPVESAGSIPEGAAVGRDPLPDDVCGIVPAAEVQAALGIGVPFLAVENLQDGGGDCLFDYYHHEGLVADAPEDLSSARAWVTVMDAEMADSIVTVSADDLSQAARIGVVCGAYAIQVEVVVRYYGPGAAEGHVPDRIDFAAVDASAVAVGDLFVAALCPS